MTTRCWFHCCRCCYHCCCCRRSLPERTKKSKNSCTPMKARVSVVSPCLRNHIDAMRKRQQQIPHWQNSGRTSVSCCSMGNASDIFRASTNPYLLPLTMPSRRRPSRQGTFPAGRLPTSSSSPFSDPSVLPLSLHGREQERPMRPTKAMSPAAFAQ